MFGEQAFQSWLHVLIGALWFAGLFVLVVLLMEQFFGGRFQLSPRAASFGVAAFVGYVGAALLIRYDASSPGP